MLVDAKSLRPLLQDMTGAEMYNRREISLSKVLGQAPAWPIDKKWYSHQANPRRNDLMDVTNFPSHPIMAGISTLLTKRKEPRL